MARTTFVLSITVWLVAQTISLPAQAAQVSIAAVVGDEAITTIDVAERRDLVMANAGIAMTVENQAKITPRIVQSLIDETLQLQEAKRNSITISDDDLKKAVDGMKTRGDKPQSMRDFVTANGLSVRSLENQVRAQMAWNKLVQRKLKRNVNVSQDEIRRAQQSAAASPGELELRLQVLEFDLSKPSANEKLVEQAALELKSGADMASLAANYIRNPAIRYNPPSWVPEGQLPPPLQQALRNVGNGQVSAPIRSGNLVQLLQVMERQSAPKLADSTEYALKQMAIEVPKKRDKKTLTTLREAAATLRANPGDCTSEAVPKVALPVKVNFVRLQLAGLSPQQRSVVKYLEVGEVSEPLMGADALRLVVMCEKIEPSVGALPDAELIRQQLFAEKIELEAQKHLRNLRRDAFIDVKGTSEQ